MDKRDTRRIPPRRPQSEGFRRPPKPAEREEGEEGPDEMPTVLAGRNPIREALKSGHDMDKLLVQKGDLSGTAAQIVAMARERKIVVQYVDKRKLDEMAPGHQGLCAVLPAHAYASMEDILARAAQKGEKPIVVVLDGVTDPHNLGAIIRSAEVFGAHGVVIGKRRAAGLTPIALKASAGAALLLPVARVTNISKAVEELKAAGLWAVAGVMDGRPARDARLSPPLALVMGDEGEGVSRLVRQVCDEGVSIPMSGQVGSLNASVATGVLLYEIVRAK